MRDQEAQLLATVVTSTKTTSNGTCSPGDGFLGKGKLFKLWALAAISLLALWSMLTSTVSLKWSAAGNLKRVDHRFDSAFRDHLDILEVEEREKMVKHMWNVYSRHSKGIRLPSFWQAAFDSAYEDLSSEVDATQNDAISEIAKMSLHPSLLYDVEFPVPLPESADRTRETSKQDNKFIKLRKKGQ